MAGSATSIANVPLHDVLPGDYVAAEDDLRRLAPTLDTHRSAARTNHAGCQRWTEDLSLRRGFQQKDGVIPVAVDPQSSGAGS